MDIIDAVQHLELTYRFAIFFSLVFWVFVWNRSWLCEVIELAPTRLGNWIDGGCGAIVFVSFLVMLVGIVRFGVQIIFGV